MRYVNVCAFLLANSSRKADRTSESVIFHRHTQHLQRRVNSGVSTKLNTAFYYVAASGAKALLKLTLTPFIDVNSTVASLAVR